MTDLPLAPRDAFVAAPALPQVYLVDEPSLGRMVGAVWANRWLALAIMATVLALTVAAVMLWPRTYTATASLIVDYEVTDPLTGKELPIGQVGGFIATQMDLLQTPALLLAVVDRLDLTNEADFRRGHTPASGTLRDWVAAQVGKALEVSRSPHGGQLIHVSFSARRRALAAAVANAVVDVYREQDAARAAGPPAERARRYAAQLDALQAKVERARQAAITFQQSHGLADDGTRTDVDVLRLASLDERLLAAQNARRVAELRAAQDSDSSDEVLASPRAQAQQAQLSAAEQRLAQLERQFTPAYPDVREARRQVDDLRQAVGATVRSYADNAAAGRASALRLEASLQQAAAAQRARVLERGRLQDEAARYRLELAAAQTVYQRWREAYDPLAYAVANARSNVGLVSRATPPVTARKPRVLAGLALGGALALLLGLGVPIVHDRLHRRVRSRDDLLRDHGVPVLAEFGRLPMRAAVA